MLDRDPVGAGPPVAPPLAPPPAGAGRRRDDDGARSPAPSLVRRLLRLALAVVGLFVVLAGFSLGTAIAAAGNTTPSERAVEWLRDHNAGGLVNTVEHWWFTSHPPKEGGVPDRDLTIAAADASPSTAPAPAAKSHTDAPARVPTAATPALPGEGVWQPVGPSFGGVPAMYATQVRPDSTHTSLLAGLVWIDPKLASFSVFPGRQEPGGNWSTPAEVPVERRLGLLAAFNGGFRMGDANGGFYLEGRAEVPLRDGAASFVVHKDGTATVGQWGRDVSMTDDVEAVRQNLVLIVDGGKPVDGLDDNSNGQWGDTLGNKVLVWRSAVCVDAKGGIIYGAGPGLGARSLADLMQRAGCQRAMELDINPAWTTFNFYAPTTPGDPASVHGTKLLPDMKKPADRYLSNDDRDFVAVFRRDG